MNDKTITRKELEDYLVYKQQIQPDIEHAPQTVLDELINNELIKQEAIGAGIDQRPDVIVEMERLRTSLLVNTLVEERIGASRFSDDELKAEYAAQITGVDGKEYKARHILVETEQEARQVIEELRSDADFAELAKKHSKGPTATEGGDLGWFREQTMVPAFAAAVKTMSKNAFTKDPIQTPFGWHVILLEDSRAVDPPTFGEARQRLEEILTNKALRKLLGELRQKSTIVVHDADN